MIQKINRLLTKHNSEFLDDLLDSYSIILLEFNGLLPSSFSQFLSANSSYTFSTPTGFPFSAFGYSPQVVIFDYVSSYIGLLAGTYPSSPSTSSQSITSNYTPNGSTVNSILIHCNLVNNDSSYPTDILDCMPINSTFGSNITYQPPYPKYVNIVERTYNNMCIYLTDQNGNDIYINDSNLMISILIQMGDYVPFSNTSPPVVNPIQPLQFSE